MLELNQLRLQLRQVAQHKATIDYKTLVDRLAIRPPNSIQKLATGLEQLMEEDALLMQPQTVAVVVQKQKPTPRAGFFIKARALGLYEGPDEGPEAEMWHQMQLERLWAEVIAQ